MISLLLSLVISRRPGRPAEKVHKILLQQHQQQPTDDDDDDDDDDDLFSFSHDHFSPPSSNPKKLSSSQSNFEVIYVKTLEYY